MELTILIPCLNEAETLATCIRKARKFLSDNNVDGEVLVSDNGSTDKSKEIAVAEGARLVFTKLKGYGNALIYGNKKAYGKFVIIGDADDSYDFYNLMPFLNKLREGYDLVIGNRFAGGIENGAMPWSHRYIGNPILSFIGRIFFKSKITDFHCGLRGYNRKSITNLNLQASGMEYASEMIVKSELNGLKIAEISTTLKKDGRSRPSHLRTIHDGWRHLKFLLMYSPNWLLLYPGFIALFLGSVIGVFFVTNQIRSGEFNYNLPSLLYCTCLLFVGFNFLQMYLIVKIYTFNIGCFFRNKTDWNKAIDEDKFIFLGFCLVFIGIVLNILTLKITGTQNVNDIIAEQKTKIIIPSAFLQNIGFQLICSGFIIGLMKIQNK